MVEFEIPNYNGKIYLKKELRKTLNTQVLFGIVNAKTVTLFPSDVKLDDVERSLEIVLEDIRLRQGKPKRGKRA